MQVEGVLLAHGAVVQAAAFGIENQVMGEIVHAAVTLNPGILVGGHARLHLRFTGLHGASSHGF